jgi:hypothetical protein
MQKIIFDEEKNLIETVVAVQRGLREIGNELNAQLDRDQIQNARLVYDKYLCRAISLDGHEMDFGEWCYAQSRQKHIGSPDAKATSSEPAGADAIC